MRRRTEADMKVSRRALNEALATLAVSLVAIGCGSGDATSGEGGGGGGGSPPALGCEADAPASNAISCVLWFEPGPGAGHGEDDFPRIIQGEPTGIDDRHQSLDVLSLGRGGEIAFGFGGNAIVDGEGPDFVIFENPFLFGASGAVFAEPGEVSVSEDGEAWTTFPCAADVYPFTGCAGWHPVLANADNGLPPDDPALAGGDAFDLAEVGMTRARFIRIRDVSNYGGAPQAGFDLDAARIIHAAR